jgi:hypothetical protein
MDIDYDNNDNKSPQEFLIDELTNLMHLAARVDDLDFDACLATAIMHFEHEHENPEDVPHEIPVYRIGGQFY